MKKTKPSSIEIKTYNNCKVELVSATENPLQILGLALDLPISVKRGEVSATTDRIHRVIVKNHTTFLEFIDLTFLLKGVSRSFLAQITRHRIASFMSTSQHYQNGDKYGFIVSKEDANNPLLKKVLEKNVQLFHQMINEGRPRWEARQVLPNAAGVDLLIKINARSLMNLFNLRLCYRNTGEMTLVVGKMYAIAMAYCPEIFRYMGPDCHSGGCRQGAKACGRKWLPPFTYDGQLRRPLIIEGPDGSGKTSLTGALSAKTGTEIMHFGAPKTFEEDMAQLAQITAIVLSGRPLILDRGLISSSVYAPIFRGYDPAKTVLAFEEAIASKADMLLLTADLEQLVERFDGEYIKTQNLPSLIESYEKYFKISPIHNKLRLNSSKLNCLQVMNKVTEWLGFRSTLA